MFVPLPTLCGLWILVASADKNVDAKRNSILERSRKIIQDLKQITAVTFWSTHYLFFCNIGAAFRTFAATKVKCKDREIPFETDLNQITTSTHSGQLLGLFLCQLLEKPSAVTMRSQGFVL